MSLAKQLAKHLHEVYFGGNWTTTCFKEVLKDIDWQLAIRTHQSFNSIATLVQHSGYYVGVLRGVLKEEPFTSKDELSFEHPPISNQQNWEQFIAEVFSTAAETARLVEQITDEKLSEFFVNEKYGAYYRNIAGITEHLHYHLGQIVILKKLSALPGTNS